MTDQRSETVLVTGGAGFIGSHIAKDLLSDGFRVVVLDDLSGGFLDHVPKGVAFVEGSILDHGLLARLFEEHQFQYVFHLAAYAAEGLSHFIKRFNYMNNVIGSVNLINESVKHNIQCFVFTSSIAVYGAGQLPMREEMTPEPEDSYGIAKYTVERELAASRSMFGLNSIIFRPHNVYGEQQNIGDKYRNVIGIFMNQLMKGEPMTVFGDGTQTRAFSYIRDISPVMARSIQNPECYNQIFNIGADQPHSVNDLAREVAAAMDRPSQIRHLEARNEVQHAWSDHSKIRRYFGDTPATSLREGVRQMAEWAKRTGARQGQVFENIEITKNLPPSWAAKDS